MNMTVLIVYVQCFQNTSVLPQTAIFGILDSASDNSFFENNKIYANHILRIFKLYLYKCRQKKFINVNGLIAEIRKVKRIETKTVLNSSKKTIASTKMAPNR